MNRFFKLTSVRLVDLPVFLIDLVKVRRKSRNEILFSSFELKDLQTAEINKDREPNWLLNSLKKERRSKILSAIKAKLSLSKFNKTEREVVETIFTFVSFHVTNYKNALYELVEGHREVTQNDEFIFENGETVKERMKHFEDRLKETTKH